MCENKGLTRKLYNERVNKDVLKFSFRNMVVDQWNILPEEDIKATSINSLKHRIDTLLSIN